MSCEQRCTLSNCFVIADVGFSMIWCWPMVNMTEWATWLQNQGQSHHQNIEGQDGLIACAWVCATT